MMFTWTKYKNSYLVIDAQSLKIISSWDNMIDAIETVFRLNRHFKRMGTKP